MITERMTEKEIEAEMLADSPNVVNYVEKAIHQKFRRIVLKSSQFPVCIHKEYTSRRKNKWILILRAYSKKIFSTHILVTIIAIMGIMLFRLMKPVLLSFLLISSVDMQKERKLICMGVT
ncbi:MAG: hypothetical protein LUH15_12255 [Tannerellaceae bacterium]|nr:hypothetical protein [Tannerellaceae bacterium]